MTGPAATTPDTPERFARELRGYGPIGIAAILFVLAGNFLFIPLSALLVLLWRYLSGAPWRDIGYVRPKSWPRTILLGIGFGVLLKLIMKALVMPLLGAPAVNPAYHHLVGNAAALPLMLYLVIVGAGFGEETVYRGFLFERLKRLPAPAIVLVTALLFGLVHYPEQGLAGVEQATIVAFVFGGIYARTGALPLLMIAHAAFDLAALAIIYWNVEYQVAHFLFK